MAKKKKPKKPYRVQHRFWLDISRNDEFDINEQVYTLKSERSFIGVIRDGIRLVCDLRAGQLDVLQELFPHMVAKIEARVMPDPSDLNNKFEELKKLIEENKIIPLFGNDNSMTMIQAGEKSITTTGKPIAGGLKSLSKPTFDDDDDVQLTIAKTTSTESAMNFLTAMANLNTQ